MSLHFSKMAVVRARFFFNVHRRSSASSLPLLRSNTLWNLNGVFPSSAVKGKSTKASDDDEKHQTSQGDLKSPSPSPEPRKIFVGNLRRITEDDLFKYFSKYGEIEKLEGKRKWLSNLLQGFAFVTFCDIESAKKALAETHVLNGDDITVGHALKEKKPHYQGKKELMVLVTNILKSTSKEAIENHFSQFGKVDNVVLLKGQSDVDLDSCYVVFSSLSGVKNSVEEPTQRIAEQGINSQVIKFSKTGEVKEGATGLLVRFMPGDVTVDSLRDYFQNFGDIEYLELFIDRPNIDNTCNAAFLYFQNESTVDELVKTEDHIINGSQIIVEKGKSLLTAQQRSDQVKVSVVGIPHSTNRWDVIHFFREEFGVEAHVAFFRKIRAQSRKVICVVRLVNQSDLKIVLTKTDVTFRGVPLHFHQLVWSKKDLSEQQEL